MWFSAVLLFESHVGDLTSDPKLQEESVHILRAENEASARSKAEAIGQQEQHEYLNDEGLTVRWRFIRVTEIQDLCEADLYDGMEVYSRISWRRSE